MTTDKFYDAIVAGAGAVGLFLACELAAAGVSVLVLERETDGKSTWKNGALGLRGLNSLSVQAFYRRGMLDKVFDDLPSEMLPKTEGFKFAGHFAGIGLNYNKIDFTRWKYHIPGPSVSPTATNLGRVEAVLEERALSLGASVLRGTEVSRIVEEDGRVRVWSGERCFEAQWLVGCDGGRSTVRKAVGFDFVGTEPQFTAYITLCTLDRPEILGRGFQQTPRGMYIMAGSERVYAIEFDTSFDRTKPVTREHFQDVLRRVSGTDIAVTALHQASSNTDRARQVTSYRRGRVFLAGDSAHIHSPLGAQGLNLGILDAMNLGWKLAAAVKGTAASDLLDSYHTERHPPAAWVLDWTRAQTAILNPSPQGQAMYNIMRDVIDTPDANNYFVDRVWGLAQRYNLGTDAHPLAGFSVPDFEFDDGERLATKLQAGRFLLIDFKSDPSVAEFAKPWEPAVDYLASGAKETFGFKALLVRPDGIVAWVAEDAVDVDTLKTALTTWLTVPEIEP